MELYQFGPNIFSNGVPFFSDIIKIISGLESINFPNILQNVVDAESEQRDSHGKLGRGHQKVMQIFCLSMGTLNYFI